MSVPKWEREERPNWKLKKQINGNLSLNYLTHIFRQCVTNCHICSASCRRFSFLFKSIKLSLK